MKSIQQILRQHFPACSHQPVQFLPLPKTPTLSPEALRAAKKHIAELRATLALAESEIAARRATERYRDYWEAQRWEREKRRALDELWRWRRVPLPGAISGTDPDV